MAATREKAISYRRAVWLIDGPAVATLEQYLKQAHRKLKTVAERTYKRENSQCIRSVKNKSPHGGGIFVHITADTPGEEASIVPNAGQSGQEVDVITAAAPVGSEFMDGDAFLYINGNDACVCLTGLRDGSIREYLCDLFKKAALGDNATKFDLQKVANIDKIKMLHKQGVKEIELRATMFQATHQREVRTNEASGVLRSAAKFINDVLFREDVEVEDGIRVQIILKTDERLRKNIILGEKKIEKIAVDVVTNQVEYDDYVIVTKSGQRIGPKEIFVRALFQIDSKGKSVTCDKAWLALEKFYKELKHSGVLEQ